MPLTSRGYPYPAPADPADGPAALQALAAGVDTDVSASLPDLALTSHGDAGTLIAAAYSSSSIPLANYAIISVIRPKVTVTPTKFCWWCSVQSGNYDVGIVDVSTRARLWSLGSTACPVSGNVVDPIAAGPTLTAGTRYGLVFAADNTTLELITAYVSSSYLGMTLAYDGTILYGRVAASFPIPATLPVWSSASYSPAVALRA